ncbi:MAG: class I adenylate cyclase [Nitrospinae bacterium]|nr:class I adenylate cyclase [Nitrospinota bacterium]
MGLFGFLKGDKKEISQNDILGDIANELSGGAEEVSAKPSGKTQAASSGKPTGELAIIDENRKSFFTYNEFKLERCHKILSKEASAAFDLLPFLLHTNIEGLPGTIPIERLPMGIIGYDPDMKKITEALTLLFRKIPCDLKALEEGQDEKIDFDSLSLIGSIGTISQGAKSDLDFWLCLDREKFDGDQLEILQEKLTEIETWTMERAELETHFFITDINGVKAGNFGESDEESSGSAQAKILKEEYFRTVTMVEGKVPFWCVVPVCDDETYDDYMNKMIAADCFQGYMDFGNTPDISFDEFLGASLWQINKALGSPFKSVIKMALLDSYTEDSHTKSALLCDIVKTSIHEQIYELKRIDPYVVLFERTLRFYKKTKRTKALLLLQKCIYLKSGVLLMPADLAPNAKLNKYKSVISGYVAQWKWDKKTILNFNDFKNWKFQSMKLINDEVNNYLIETYKGLSDKLKAMEGVKLRIDPKDLAVLGRKLYTFYAKKPSKIECTSQFMDKSFTQDALTFYQPENQNSGGWKVFLGNFIKNDIICKKADSELIRAGDDIVSISAWLVLNKVFSEKTQVTAISKSSLITINELRGLLNELKSTIPPLDVNSLKKEHLLTKAFPQNLFVIINFTSPNWVKDIEDIAIIMRNTWGEVLIEHHQGKAGLKTAIDYINQCKPKGRLEMQKTYKFFVADKANRENLEMRLNSLLKTHVSFHMGKTMFYKH